MAVDGKKVCVVMPAYNAQRTLREAYAAVMAQGVVDSVVIVDDASQDDTASIARALDGAHVIVHAANGGYGANQKTCYRAALQMGADIVVMVHADYQYTPLLIGPMATMIASGLFDAVLASRILGGRALAGGMPWWRYLSNRALTWFSNLMTGAKLSEYHTGYRAFSRNTLEGCAFDRYSDDFAFDAQILTDLLWQDRRIGEVTCPTRYDAGSSSIRFLASVRYGTECVRLALAFRLARHGLLKDPLRLR